MLRLCRSVKLSGGNFPTSSGGGKLRPSNSFRRSTSKKPQEISATSYRPQNRLARTEIVTGFSRSVCTSAVLQSSGSLPREKLSSTTTNDDGGSKNPLKRFLMDKIRVSGPITVAEFMKICVGSPASGYYSKQSGEIFGIRGDFITAPEFTQLIGELIGVWVVNEFIKLGHTGDWQLVELGPGSGTLMQDIMGVLRKFRLEEQNLSIHLLETSRQLIKEQATVLCGDDDEFTAASQTAGERFLCSKVSQFGPTVYWYDNLAHIPKKFSIVVAHEFFDAMPVHKFRRTDKGWREVLIGLDEKRENLALTLARDVTPAQKLYLTKELEDATKVDDLEISPASANILLTLAELINENGGAVLCVDYGQFGAERKTGDTFRAFRNHKLVDPLLNPGRCDVTCDLNYDYLLSQLADKVAIFGPLAQRDFLFNLGLKVRFDTLMKAAQTDQERAYLQKSFDMLTSSAEMGDRFKAVALFPRIIKDVLHAAPPSGFCPLS